MRFNRICKTQPCQPNHSSQLVITYLYHLVAQLFLIFFVELRHFLRIQQKSFINYANRKLCGSFYITVTYLKEFNEFFCGLDFPSKSSSPLYLSRCDRNVRKSFSFLLCYTCDIMWQTAELYAMLLFRINHLIMKQANTFIVI